jgi:hypothetical protein
LAGEVVSKRGGFAPSLSVFSLLLQGEDDKDEVPLIIHRPAPVLDFLGRLGIKSGQASETKNTVSKEGGEWTFL